MKAKELAIELMKHPEFDVEFVFTDGFSELEPHFPNVRSFKIKTIGDIGYSSKIIQLSED